MYTIFITTDELADFDAELMAELALCDLTWSCMLLYTEPQRRAPG